MSTKIYEAYQLKRGVDVWECALSIRQRGIRNARKVLSGFLTEMHATNARITRKGWAELLGVEDLTDGEKPWSYIECENLVRQAFRRQANRYERHTAAFDVSVSFRKLGRCWYLIPTQNGIMGNILSFLRKDPKLNFFGYWDNTDRPQRTSTREWNDRRKVWDALSEPDARWQEKLVMEIVEPSTYGFSCVSPAWQLAAKAGEIPKNHPLAR